MREGNTGDWWSLISSTNTPILVCTQVFWEVQPGCFSRSHSFKNSTATDILLFLSFHTYSFREQQEQELFTVFGFFLLFVPSCNSEGGSDRDLRKESNCVHSNSLKEKIAHLFWNPDSVSWFFSQINLESWCYSSWLKTLMSCVHFNCFRLAISPVVWRSLRVQKNPRGQVLFLDFRWLIQNNVPNSSSAIHDLHLCNCR